MRLVPYWITLTFSVVTKRASHHTFDGIDEFVDLAVDDLDDERQVLRQRVGKDVAVRAGERVAKKPMMKEPAIFTMIVPQGKVYS